MSSVTVPSYPAGWILANELLRTMPWVVSMATLAVMADWDHRSYPPPSDPWDWQPDGSRDEPTRPEPAPMHGRAALPPLRQPTAELPEVDPEARRATPGPPRVSWYRTSKASRRTLSDGWGFTFFGVLVLVCGWGIWAAAESRAFIQPLVDPVLVLLVGALVFVVMRSASRVVLVGMLQRSRPHARWSHFFTGVFLTAAGVSYVANSAWLIQGAEWIRQQIERF
jgi:hypothetical protein